MRSYILFIAFIFLASGAFARAAYKVDGNNITIELEGIGVKSKLLKIEMWSANTVRIRTTMNDHFTDEPTLLGEQPTQQVKFKAAYSAANIEVVAEGIQVNVAEDGIVRILSGTGRKLLVESNRTFQPSTLEDGAYKINQKFFLNKGEHIYGFGQEDRQDRFNLRDKKFEVKQDQSTIATPVLYSEKGFAMIWDNFSPTHFEDNASALSLTSEIGDEIDYFVICGPEWGTIVAEIRKLSGVAPMLPRRAFGFQLNPSAYSSEAELNTAINQYRSLGIPVENNVADQKLYLEEKELTAKEGSGRFANAYAYHELKPKYETLLTSDERSFVPTHTNIPGIQKYGTYTAAGEISQCWESLKCQVSAGINSSLAGQPYWSTTLGGFKTEASCTADPLNELIVRWNQFAAFTPIYEGSPLAYEAWETGGASDPNFMAIKKAIELRYQLLPYIYTMAYNVYAKNGNIIRSLLYDYQKNENVHINNHQYMFGPSIMVCPVVAKTNQILVSLPIESNWVDFWTGKYLTGGTDLKQNVTLEHIPLFVKQGSIIPLGQVNSNSLDSLGGPIEIRVYGGADAEFKLYEDENEGKGYKTGAFSRISFEYSEKAKTLSIGTPEGEYPGMPIERVFNIVLVSENDGIGVKPATNVQQVVYKGKKVKVKFE